MPVKPKTRNQSKGRKEPSQDTSNREEHSLTHVGDISGGKGFAIGPNARAMVIEIGSLFDLSVLGKLLKRHSLFVTSNIALQGTAIAIWRHYTDRFSIPVSMLTAVLLLTEIGLVSSYLAFRRRKQKRVFSGIGVVALFALTGSITLEYDRLVHPARFEVETFGVAVAQFGEGPDLRNTERARDVSQAVLQQLTQQAQEKHDLRFVQFRPIGLVRTAEEAFEDGQRIGADLVIWGRLQVSEEKTFLNFSILETPDKVSNPMFPRVLPLFEPAATGFVRIDSQGSEQIARGTTAISSFTFGLAHFFQWDFSAAARAFAEAPATSIEESDDYRYLLHLYHGLSLQWPGQLERADEEFQKSIDLHPEDPAPRIARAFGYNSLGRIADAAAEARKAWQLCNERIQLDSNDYRAFFDRALANEILHDWKAALADYQTTSQLVPDFYIAHIGVVRMHLVLNQLLEAISAAQATIELAESREANPAWAYLYLAHAYERSRDLTHARLAYQKATSLAPGVDWIRFQAGQFYAGTGDPHDQLLAEQEYRAMIRVSSNRSWAHSTLADFYVQRSRLEEAVVEYKAAIQTNSEAGGSWVALANVLLQLEQKDQAREAYERAVELEPDNFSAQFLYGNFLFYQGELEAAIRHWDLARQINPHNCGLLLNIGQAYESLGDRERAEAFYQMAPGREVTPDQQC